MVLLLQDMQPPLLPATVPLPRLAMVPIPVTATVLPLGMVLPLRLATVLPLLPATVRIRVTAIHRSPGTALLLPLGTATPLRRATVPLRRRTHRSTLLLPRGMVARHRRTTPRRHGCSSTRATSHHPARTTRTVADASAARHTPQCSLIRTM